METELMFGLSHTDQPDYYDSPHSLRAITHKDISIIGAIKGNVILIHVFAYCKLYI